MATEESTDRWRGLRRVTIVLAALGVASAVAASVLHFSSPDPSVTRTFGTLGMIGAVAAGVAAVIGRTTGQRAIFAILAVLSFIASSSVFGMTYS